jgi:hypothetical protein
MTPSRGSIRRHVRIACWGDPSQRSLRDDLPADLWDSPPAAHPGKLQLQAPV